MLDLRHIVELLQARKLSVVAKETGLHYQTVWRVASGNTTRVSYDTLKKISDYLER